jgi:hypothetical protein
MGQAAQAGTPESHRPLSKQGDLPQNPGEKQGVSSMGMREDSARIALQKAQAGGQHLHTFGSASRYRISRLETKNYSTRWLQLIRMTNK